MVDYSQVYANTQVIAKPPIKSHKETLGSAIDSFYNDIASIEKIRNDHETEQVLPVETVPVTVLQGQPAEVEQPQILTDSVLKERKKKKVLKYRANAILFPLWECEFSVYSSITVSDKTRHQQETEGSLQHGC